MEFFKIRRVIPFMRHALVFNIISLITFLAACFFLANWASVIGDWLLNAYLRACCAFLSRGAK